MLVLLDVTGGVEFAPATESGAVAVLGRHATPLDAVLALLPSVDPDDGLSEVMFAIDKLDAARVHAMLEERKRKAAEVVARAAPGPVVIVSHGEDDPDDDEDTDLHVENKQPLTRGDK